jgi:hypothetical protein
VRENDHHENIFIVEDNIDAELWHGELTRPRRKWSEKIIVDKVITPPPSVISTNAPFTIQIASSSPTTPLNLFLYCSNIENC